MSILPSEKQRSAVKQGEYLWSEDILGTSWADKVGNDGIG